MKKLVILIAILLANFYGYSQNIGLSIQNNPSNNPITSGTTFNLEINVGSIKNCNLTTLTVNIGSLVYVAVSGNAGMSYNPTLNQVTITTPIGSSQSVYTVPLQFVAGITCDGFTQSIKVTSNCSTNISTFTVTANTTNNSKATLSYSIPGSTALGPICFGQLVKYRVGLNVGVGNYDVINPLVNFQLAECANIVSIYRNSIQMTIPNSTVATGIKTYNWLVSSTTNSLLSTTSASAYFDVYVRYGCGSSGGCSTGLFSTPKCWLTGSYPSQLSTCASLGPSYLFTQSPITTVSHTFTNANCVGSSPCTQIGAPATLGLSSLFRCPTHCVPSNFVSFNITIPEGYQYSAAHPFELILSIPNNMRLKSGTAPTFNNLAVSYRYENSTSYTPIYDSTLNIRNVKWSSSTLSGVTTFNSLSTNFEPVNSLVTQPMLFSYTLTQPDGTSTPPTPYQTSIESCVPLINSSLRIKNISATATDFVSSSSAKPGQTMRFRMIIRNQGNSDMLNPIITQLLGPNFICDINDLNLQYSFQPGNSFDPPGPLTNAGANNIISDINYGSAQVSVDNSGTLIIQNLVGSNFILPVQCPNNIKTLYIEFDAKVKLGLPVFTQMTNAFTTSQVSTNYSQLSSPITVTILSEKRIGSKMMARCHFPSNNTWTQEVNVRNGELVDFKIILTNEGSENVYLENILNQKPQNGDQFEFVSGNTPAYRNSDFKINYKCGIPPQVIKPATLITPTILYSAGGVNMSRGDLLFPTNNYGTSPSWSPGNCSETSSNWMRISFSSNNYENRRLKPGEFVEIIYSGKVEIPVGENPDGYKAYNSFSSKNFYNTNPAINFNSNNLSEEDRVVVNITENGCVTPCIDCASFGLIKGEKYLVSGWVKEESKDDSRKQFKSYLNSFINITFKQETTNAVLATYTFAPSGDIIDGWQRIIGEITVPGDDTIRVGDMILELMNESKREKVMSYFDDVRVLPTKGNMKSFVYDQKTQRLMAELDENNYSTFYEYDLEGGLIRIKKETEKGVFTVQEDT